MSDQVRAVYDALIGKMVLPEYEPGGSRVAGYVCEHCVRAWTAGEAPTHAEACPVGMATRLRAELAGRDVALGSDEPDYGLPWRVNDQGLCVNGRGEIVVDLQGSDCVLEDEGWYAARICAAMNFCAGLTTEDLRRGPTGATTAEAALRIAEVVR